jgi:hypothetical protein
VAKWADHRGLEHCKGGSSSLEIKVAFRPVGRSGTPTHQSGFRVRALDHLSDDIQLVTIN